MKKRNRLNRSGAATVEFALCVPLIVLVTLGGIEGSSMIFTKQSLATSAYEGIKVAIGQNRTFAEVETATQQVLDGRLLNAATVTVTPTNFADVERGTLITVTVSAPSDTNSVFPFGPFEGRQLAVSATMVKE